MKRTLFTVGIAALLGVFGTAQAGGDPQAGKTKSATCAGCHGANGEGVAPNPALAGKPEAQFVQAIKDYKSGKRANPAMKTFASQLSDQDVANLAAYYASLKKK
jgi:cytochrome c553